MVPKFYLDLWNFGLAPSRVEYPALSTDAAKGMPIEIFIGKNKETTLKGRFVAFSKRINSVLVPESFSIGLIKNLLSLTVGTFIFCGKMAPSMDLQDHDLTFSNYKLFPILNRGKFPTWKSSLSIFHFLLATEARFRRRTLEDHFGNFRYPLSCTARIYR